jgi:hypothetical protein
VPKALPGYFFPVERATIPRLRGKTENACRLAFNSLKTEGEGKEHHFVRRFPGFARSSF